MELREVIEELPVVSADSKLSRAIAVLSRGHAHGVAVIDDRRNVTGVIDDRTLRGIREDAELTKAKGLAEKTMLFDIDVNTAEDAVNFFLNSHARVLPVLKKKKLAGCITRASVLGLLAGTQAVKGKRVSEYMHPAVIVSEGVSLAQAISRMRENNAYHVIVIGDSGRMAGFLTSYDIAVNVVPHYRTQFRTDRGPVTMEGVDSESVTSVMNSLPKQIRSDATLEEAARLMRAENVTALPVIENGKPVGLLTATGVLHCCLKDEPESVVVLGLRDDERAFKKSIEETGAEFLKKVGKTVAADMLTIHIKSRQEGAKRRYAVRARLFVKGRVISAGTPDTTGHKSVWDAHLAVKEVLEELSNQAADKYHRKNKPERHWQGE
jgi:CBS domain-containing protein